MVESVMVLRTGKTLTKPRPHLQGKTWGICEAFDLVYNSFLVILQLER